MRVIVPKTPPDAYNPKRKPGTLLQHQLEHLEWAVRPAGERAGKFQVKPAATEAEAAARIEALTLELQRQTNPAPIAAVAATTVAKRSAKPRRTTKRARRGRARR